MKNIKRMAAVFLSAALIIGALPLSVNASVDISDKIKTGAVYEFSSINENAPEDNKNRVLVSLTQTNPEEPENPENPENPEDPENPENPEEPENPENPEEPENPENPDDSGDLADGDEFIANSLSDSSENEEDESEEPQKIKYLNIDYTCDIDAYEYRVGLSKVGGGFQTFIYVEPEDRTENGVSCNGFTACIDLDKYGIESGNYYINISRARSEEQTDHSKYGDGGNCYRNAVLNVSQEGEYSLLDFNGIQESNEAIRNDSRYNNPDYYTDKTMEDVPYCLNNLINDTGAKTPSKLDSQKVSLTKSQISYIESLAKTKTADCQSVYEKAKAIYSYVSANTFYDEYSHAHVNTVKTVNNPYTNLKKIEDGKNAFTCCVGYSSLMCALLRSLDIPTRVIYGIHLSIPKETWLDNIDPTDMREDDHYWVEFFDGSRWIVADANMGTSNKWYRDEARYEGGNSGAKAQNNFTFFDPSPQQLAASHCIIGIFSKTLITNKNDVDKLLAFLNQKATSTKTNANILGFEGALEENGTVRSWNLDSFYSNVFSGKLEKIDFTSVSKLSGAADFSNCTGLRWFNASENSKLTSLNLSGDTALESAYVSKCSVADFKALDCPSLSKFSTNGNPLKSAEYSFRGTKTAKITASGGGTFQVAYASGKHTMKAYAGEGYYFSGWFDSKGNKLSANAEYSTSTSSSFTYTAKFLKLAAPSNVKISIASSTGQKITWNKVSAADGYYLYKSTSKNSGYVATKISGASNTSITKTGLKTGKTYYYYVVAYKKTSGASYTSYSAPSAVVSKQVVPPAPKVTLSTGSKYITVKFAKVANVNGYEIYRATSSGGKYSRVTTIKQGASTVKFKNTNLKKGKKYYYKVRAYKTTGSKKIYSAYSTVKSIKCK
ncbi:MAG: transglutaminase domain-containing protein [Eubacterium sp.]|nr:transglutaminase domain-containing protein [Eubacterium sp.]